MSTYLINDRPGIDPRPPYMVAVCPGCRVITDWIKPRRMEPDTYEAWLVQQRNGGREVAGRLHRSLWQEGVCMCAESEPC